MNAIARLLVMFVLATGLWMHDANSAGMLDIAYITTYSNVALVSFFYCLLHQTLQDSFEMEMHPDSNQRRS